MTRTKLALAGALLAVLMGASAVGSVAYAQGPTPTPGPKGNVAQLFWQALATRLGITVQTLQQDMVAAAKDAINQAVQKGLMTQAQANTLQQRLQNAPLGQAPRFPGLGPFGFTARRGFILGRGVGQARGFFGPDVLEAAANALGMSPADVTTALRNGKTLADLAKQQNVDPSKVQLAIVNAEKAALDQLVTDGLMTQTRADALKAQLDPSKIDLSRPFFGLGRPGGAKPTTPTPTPTPTA